MAFTLGACSKKSSKPKPRYGKLEPVSIKHEIANFTILLPFTRGVIKHKGRIQINLGKAEASAPIREGLNIRLTPWPKDANQARKEAILFGDIVRNKRDGSIWLVEQKRETGDSRSHTVVIYHKLPGKTGKEAALQCTGSYTDLRRKGLRKFNPSVVPIFEKMCRSIKLK